MYAVENNDYKNNITVELTGMGNNDLSAEDGGDLSMITGEFNDVSPTGAGSRHQKNPSFLTKDFSISRHERRKSAMDSEPCMTDNSVAGTSDIIGGHYAAAASAAQASALE